MSEFECPTCERGGFESKVGMKIHHANAHGESLVQYVELSCERCDSTYHRHPNLSDSSRFCSQACQSEWREDKGIIPASEDNPHWDDEPPRKRALERAGYACQRCGSEAVKVRHLIPRAAGGPNHMKNLVALCDECHKKAHTRIGQLAETHPELLEKIREIVCASDE